MNPETTGRYFEPEPGTGATPEEVVRRMNSTTLTDSNGRSLGTVTIGHNSAMTPSHPLWRDFCADLIMLQSEAPWSEVAQVVFRHCGDPQWTRRYLRRINITNTKRLQQWVCEQNRSGK